VAAYPPFTITLRQNKFQVLHTARVQPCSVTITASSNAELGGVTFRTKTFPMRLRRTFVAEQASLGIWATVPVATIEARPPDGVASLEITYVIRTGKDAR
jgi:hypothetical protein